MKWITRERPKIDRVACPWLIARFIDREPEFIFVPSAEVLAKAAVRGADTDTHSLHPACAGLFAVSLGLSRNFADDHEQLRHGFVVYDALYAWCRDAHGEKHTWNPQAKP